VEFFDLCREHLSQQGIVMMNIISAASGDKAELFQSFGATIHAVFPICYVMPMEPLKPGDVQNIVLACASTSLPQDDQIQGSPLSYYNLEDSRPLVDEKNPIEAILARQLLSTPE
jgi:spermidine synthase